MNLFKTVPQSKQHKFITSLLHAIYTEYPDPTDLHWLDLAGRLACARITGQIVCGWLPDATEQTIWIETTHFIIDMHKAPDVEASIIALDSEQAGRYRSVEIVERWDGA